MSWNSVASEIFNSTAFLFADSELRKFIRNAFFTHRGSKELPAAKRKEDASIERKNSASEYLRKMDELNLKMKAGNLALQRSFRQARDIEEAKKRGFGLEGLRNTLKKQGIDL